MPGPKREPGFVVIVQEFGELRKVVFHEDEAAAAEAASKSLQDSSSSEPAIEAFVVAAVRYSTS
ncbi:MAG: hypothetical protein K2W96_05675 [Gemmataceae bacterium]|nr:hypothetical protein [Gemmataceae bacterium]